MTLFVERRVAELTARLVTAPPVALLATPATVAGHGDRPGFSASCWRRNRMAGNLAKPT
ncbi:hypothetical protein [Micromonospora sp. NPDC049799]|uniref:hypothetical protein n=1 Tax=Micromonospora sp. NPDC049799 TaxID=3154741 RepID=UPI0033DD9C2D